MGLTLKKIPMSVSVVVYRQCPVCSSSNISKIGEAKDHTVSGEVFEIWKCAVCTVRFTQAVPVAEAIGKYYQSESYISHSNTRKGLMNRMYQAVRDFTIGQKRGWIEKATGWKSGTLLDIGCGTGEFLKGMADAGWQVQGLEPDAGARGQAVSKGLDVGSSEKLFDLPKASFQVITMWHVLEHVHDLHEYLEQIRALLAPGGWLLIAVPNPESTDAVAYGFDWAAWDVPRHLYHFSPDAMKRLLGGHGFDIQRTTPLPFDPFYVGMLSEKYRTGKISYPRALIQGYRSWNAARFRPAVASSVLYFARQRS